MSMTVLLPTEVEEFVRAEVSEGAAVDEVEFLTKAVELYRELKGRHQDLRARVQASLEQAARGEVSPLNTEATKAEGRRRLAQS